MNASGLDPHTPRDVRARFAVCLARMLEIGRALALEPDPETARVLELLAQNRAQYLRADAILREWGTPTRDDAGREVELERSLDDLHRERASSSRDLPPSNCGALCAEYQGSAGCDGGWYCTDERQAQARRALLGDEAGA